MGEHDDQAGTEGGGKGPGTGSGASRGADRRAPTDPIPPAEAALAAEVARGLNNLIMVITGCGDLLAEHIGQERPSRALLLEVQRAGARAKLLSRVLSVMLSREKPRPESIDLPTFAGDLRALIVPFLGDRIDLFTAVEPHAVSKARSDSGVLACALIRIAAHARAVLTDGGRLTLRAADVPAREPGKPANVHVTLHLGTWAGGAPTDPMPGLGALVDLVRAAGAALSYEPDPAFGSIYRLALPIAEPRVVAPAAGAAAPAEAPARGRQATVLVVDDEPPIRKICSVNLTAIGCRVITCGSGREALEAVESSVDEIDILLTDIMMPGMSGGELARRLRERRPGLLVIFMSGYAEEPELKEAMDGGAFEFLQKPFAKAALTETMNRLMAQLATKA